jgi:hypothetical protein
MRCHDGAIRSIQGAVIALWEDRFSCRRSVGLVLPRPAQTPATLQGSRRRHLFTLFRRSDTWFEEEHARGGQVTGIGFGPVNNIGNFYVRYRTDSPEKATVNHLPM